MDSVDALLRDARMYLSRRLVRSLAPPDRVSLNLTLRCNLDCAMCTTCYDAPELSTDEIKGIIDQTAAWGVEVLNPLGGEPFMRADIVEILDYAVRRGFYVTVTTNGTLLPPARARALARIPPDRLHLIFSLDGAEPDHDAVRGPGTWRRAVDGYLRLREADAAAGNARRKVLANSLLHRRNAARFEESLDRLAELGFDGVQVLNLFRDHSRRKAERAGLWFRDEDMPALEALAERLARRAERGVPPALQNTPEELARIPRYYREELRPLEAPCWAGWKELYVNADGTAIMCDGRLDFLAGAFGSVRERTLRELWRSPELRERRRVVKACRTPCNQTCYLRPESDSAARLAGRAARLAGRAVARRAGRRLRRVEHHPDAVLRLELSDVCPCDWPGCPTPRSRWERLVAGVPEPPTAESWPRLRDRGAIDFGRGFMGFEVVRTVVEDLRSARLRFGTIAVRWRGEPLLHPEAEPVLGYLLDAIARFRVADRLRVETDGRFLSEPLAALAGAPLPQEWVLDLDRGGGAGLERLRAARGPRTRIVLAATAAEGLDVRALARRHRALPVHLGPFPAGDGDALWIRRADAGHHAGDLAAAAALRAAAAALGLPVDAGEPRGERRCLAPWLAPTVSWDGKVVACPWDTRVEHRVGEVTAEPFSATWRGEALAALRRAARQRGVPGLPPCRDCGVPWSPNAPRGRPGPR